MNNPAAHSLQNRRARSPVWAAILSLLIPGLGQIYCHQDNKGVFLATMFVLGHWSTGGISSLILCPATGLDAFLIARKTNQSGVVRRWEFFPGIKGLQSIPPRIILLAVVGMIAAFAVLRIVRFASDK